MDKALRFIEDAIVLYKSRNKATDDDIAEAIGITRQALYGKRRGETPYKASELLALCELTKTSPNEMLGWEK